MVQNLKNKQEMNFVTKILTNFDLNYKKAPEQPKLML